MRRPLIAVLVPLLLLSGLFVGPAGATSTNSSLPSVAGGFGKSPTIKFPSANPPTKLSKTYLHLGKGPKVVSGELLVANYLGQIWKGKVFDSSYARGQLSGFPIGLGEVIPAWDTGLVGVPLGSRVLLIVPPADGYGAAGNTGAGIKGTDTIVFVIDVVAAYGKSAVGQKNAQVKQTQVNGISIKGNPGSAPSLSIAKSSVKPTKVVDTLLAQGSGPKVKAGLLVLQLYEADWTGKVVASTWQTQAPYGANVGVSGSPSIFDALIGLKIGSRMLIQLPKISTGGPYTVIADVVAEPTSAS